MSATRLVLFCLACGLWGLVVGSVLDGGWSGLSATRWLLFLVGLAVLSVVAILVQASVERRR